MPINYIQATRRGGYGKLVSTDPNPDSQSFFNEIVKAVNLKLNLGLNLDWLNYDRDSQPRQISLSRHAVELHMRRTWGSHEFQGVLLVARNLPQTRMFGHRYSDTQRIYTYNRTNRTFLLRNLIPAIADLIQRSVTAYEQRSVMERRRQDEYDALRVINEECQRIAIAHSFNENNGDGLTYFSDREKYRIIVYLNKYQIHKVLKSIQIVKSLVPANAGG